MFRYIGNKTLVVQEVLRVITKDARKGAIFCDPMTGTGSVSEGLARLGYLVIASDSLSFPAMHAEVRIRLKRAPAFSALGRNYSDVIKTLNELKPQFGYFTQEYSELGKPKNASKPRLYFSGLNAQKIDSISSQINEWESRGDLTNSEIKLLRHDLIMAVNRVANIAGTYGHYRSTFSKAALAPISLSTTSFNSFARKKNTVLIGNAEDLVPNLRMDYLYLDPPYKKRQYAANYHLLETIARGDNPEAIGESGLRNWWPLYSNFCSKKKIRFAFHEILERSSFKKAFISYSEDGLLSDEEMRELLKNYGRVKRHTFTHKRFKSNKSILSNSLNEFIYEIVR